jgi:hypothetical protein
MATGHGRTGAALSVMLLVTLAGFAAVALASSAREFHPGRNDFTTRTHIGKVHVILDVQKVNGRRQLQGVKIWVNDKPLELPDKVDLRVPDPKIKQVMLLSTASFTCIDDPCVDDSPAMLFIPYGKAIQRDSDQPGPVTGTTPCRDSFMVLDIYPEQFGAITQFICNESGEVDRVLFEPQ